jgi:hypothetical protein
VEENEIESTPLQKAKDIFHAKLVPIYRESQRTQSKKKTYRPCRLCERYFSRKTCPDLSGIAKNVKIYFAWKLSELCDFACKLYRRTQSMKKT